MRGIKRTVAWCVLALSLCAICFVLVRALWWSPESDITPPPWQSEESVATSSLPKRLAIPSLGIDAKVQYVGISKSGNMAVPSNYTDVGWYKYGVPPGRQGSAVIDGHVDNGLALPGVFKYLDKIKVGDDVYIEESDGGRLHFVVYDVEVYPYTDVPREKLFAAASSSYLNLITCGGSWLQSSHTYDHRMVVYTKLVN